MFDTFVNSLKEQEYSDINDDFYIDVAAEVPCLHDEHKGMLMLDEVYPINVNTLFEYLFTDTQFFAQMCTARRWTGTYIARINNNIELITRHLFLYKQSKVCTCRCGIHSMGAG